MRTKDKAGVLSVRVPAGVRSRLKAIAAAPGETLQGLIGGIIERYLDGTERRAPDLASVVRSLKEQEGLLRRKGIAGLWVFGSVARGDATPESDVDVAVDFAPGMEASLLDFVHIREELEAALGRPVDFGERATMTPRVTAAAEREFVRVF